MQAHIIIKPLVTEKSMSDVSKGKYTFMVAKSATKSAIKHAVKGKFNVTVSSVATSIVKGRSQRVGTRRLEVAKAHWKKATVTLKKGETIALFEPGAEENKK
jgi:large subunit ribosomal protein L23